MMDIGTGYFGLHYDQEQKNVNLVSDKFVNKKSVFAF